MFIERVDYRSEKDIPGGFDTLYQDYVPVYRVMVGGMSEVWACLERRSGRLVAVKRLLPHAMEEWRSAGAGYYEAYALRSVRHPNVLEFLEKRYDGGAICLITEFIAGINLAHFLNTWQLPIQGWLDIADQLLSGLEALHHAGVVHGDIKPDNIMLMQTREENFQVKLLDFGLAIPLGLEWQREHAEAEVPPDVMATAEYVAPELLRGKAPSVQSDLYAFAQTMYHCINGEPAFQSSDLQSLLQMQVNDDIIPLYEMRDDVPEIVWTWLAPMLEKNPDLRTPSVTAARNSLSRLRDQLACEMIETIE
ncbi:MAG: serine/threonine-protein kinase [Verrucomicrobiota bacterium]